MPGALDGLSEEQAQAVSDPGPRTLICAGPGTGKTRTLLAKAEALAAAASDGKSVVLVTFTVRAADELAHRYRHPSKGSFFAGTFHGLAFRAVRDFSGALGFSSPPKVLSPAARASMIERAQKEWVPSVSAARLGRLFGSAVGRGARVRQEIATRHRDLIARSEAIEKAFELYAEQKVQGGMVDFDDLLSLFRSLLRSDDVGPRIRRGIGHVLVDEYQDTTPLQGDIAALLADGGRSLVVVGDEMQSIYKFRGACDDAMRTFAEQNPEAKRFELTQNFRSTPQILDLANRVADRMSSGALGLVSTKADGPLPHVASVASADDAARYIAQELAQSGAPLSRQAVLARSHRDLDPIASLLADRKIPFVRRRKDDDPLEDESAGLDEAVVLSTIHQAKGLEWDVVFIASLEENRFPLAAALREDGAREEERLFYVALTRATRQLHLIVDRENPSRFAETILLSDARVRRLDVR